MDDGVHTDMPIGEYRNYPISARNGTKKPTRFVHHSAVPAYMSRFVLDLSNDIDADRKDRLIEPFTLAARYCSTFVNIHPFGDGNGRLCRIIMNAILFKIVSIWVPIGEEGETRAEYLGITARASRVFYEEDGEVERDAETSHLELAKLVLGKSRQVLETMCKSMEDR